MNDDDYEPSLNERLQHLPEGEKLIWKGGPAFWPLAREAFHVRGVALYFVILMAWRFAAALSDGQSALDALSYAAALLPLAGIAMTLLVWLAWMSARNTSYAVTTKRVLIKSGVALTGTLNIPLRYIVNAGMRIHKDGSGDFPLTIEKSERIAWLIAWPNVRPWHISHPEPMLRGVADPAPLADALAKALGGQVPALSSAPQRAPLMSHSAPGGAASAASSS